MKRMIKLTKRKKFYAKCNVVSLKLKLNRGKFAIEVNQTLEKKPRIIRGLMEKDLRIY